MAAPLHLELNMALNLTFFIAFLTVLVSVGRSELPKPRKSCFTSVGSTAPMLPGAISETNLDSINWHKVTTNTTTRPTQSERMNIEGVIPSDRITKLGDGLFGNVFRVEPQDRASYIIKQYHNPKERDHDLLRFQKIQSELIRANIDRSVIQNAKAKAYGLQSMILPDIKGKDLAQVLSENELSTSDKQRLLAAWINLINHIRNSALAAGVKIEKGIIEGFPTIQTIPSAHQLQWQLKPQNIIVESGTGRLYIVDPW